MDLEFETGVSFSKYLLVLSGLKAVWKMVPKWVRFAMPIYLFRHQKLIIIRAIKEW